MPGQISRYDEEDVKKIVAEALARQKTYSKEDVSKTLDSLADSDLINPAVAKQVLDNYVPNSQSIQTQRAVKKVERRKPRLKSQTLEIIAEDLRKVGRGIKYSIGISLGASFAAPTLVRKCIDVDYDDHSKRYQSAFQGASALFWCVNTITAMVTYVELSKSNPKLALAIGLTQIGTNVASGIYEYVRHAKNRAGMKR